MYMQRSQNEENRAKIDVLTRYSINLIPVCHSKCSSVTCELYKDDLDARPSTLYRSRIHFHMFHRLLLFLIIHCQKSNIALFLFDTDIFTSMRVNPYGPGFQLHAVSLWWSLEWGSSTVANKWREIIVTPKSSSQTILVSSRYMPKSTLSIDEK